MAKSKFSKRQVAGALLLSSTAVGTAASSSASAGNVLTDFLSKGAKTAGRYAVSGIDKAGEYLKTGVNKVSSWVKGSDVGNALREAKNSRVGQWVGNGVSKLGEKISQTDTYKNYISGHEWGTAAALLTILTTFGIYKIYKAVQNGVNIFNKKANLKNAINNFSKTVDDFVNLKPDFKEDNSNTNSLQENINENDINNSTILNQEDKEESNNSDILTKTQISVYNNNELNQTANKDQLNKNIKNVRENMESKKGDLSEYDFKTAMITLEGLESNFLYHKESKLKSAKNINELKEKFENIKEAFCNVARAYQKLQPGCINKELEHKLTIIEKKKIFKDKIDSAINLLKNQSGKVQNKLMQKLELMKNKLFVKTEEAIKGLNEEVVFGFNFDKLAKDEDLNNKEEVKDAIESAMNAGKEYCKLATQKEYTTYESTGESEINEEYIPDIQSSNENNKNT